MQALIDEIHHSIANKRWYAALTLSLTIPDICATLSAPENARTDGVKARYNAWCRKYLPEDFGPDPSLCWELRSGIVHQGMFKSAEFHKVVITTGPGDGGVHNIVLQVGEWKAYTLLAAKVCDDLLKAGQKWLDEHRTNPNVVANFPRLIQIQEDALLPVIAGVPGFVSTVRHPNGKAAQARR